MGESNVCKTKEQYAIDFIMRWIVFGVIIVVGPPLLNVWIRIIIGFDVEFQKYLPDVLVAVLSVSCNLINTCSDSAKKIARILRWIICIVLAIISIGSLVLYCLVHFEAFAISADVFEFFFYFASWVIAGCTIIGIIIEWHSA